MLKISDITLKKLKNDELIEDLPEFYDLKEVFENNPWHSIGSVFDHTLSVLEELDKLLATVKSKIKLHLSTKISKYTRKDILFLATLLHDIAKKETMVRYGRDTVICPNHEEIGYVTAKKMLLHSDLSSEEKDIVLEIVKNHGIIHLILNPNDSELARHMSKFKEEFSNIFIELILLAMADTIGSQLKNKNPTNFQFRIDFYQNILDTY